MFEKNNFKQSDNENILIFDLAELLLSNARAPSCYPLSIRAIWCRRVVLNQHTLQKINLILRLNDK